MYPKHVELRIHQ